MTLAIYFQPSGPIPAKNCLLKKLSEVRKLTTFYPGKNGHRWVTFISLKTMEGGDGARSRLAFLRVLAEELQKNSDPGSIGAPALGAGSAAWKKL